MENNNKNKNIYALGSDRPVMKNKKYRRLSKKRQVIEFVDNVSSSCRDLYFYSDEYVGDFSSSGEVSIKYRISAKDNICLHNHKVFGQPVFPTDAYLEMLVVACRAYFNITKIVFNNIIIVNPLVGSATSTNYVTVVFKKNGDNLRFIVRSNEKTEAGDTRDKIHIRGTLCRAGANEHNVGIFSPDLSVTDTSQCLIDKYYSGTSSIALGEFYRALKNLTFDQKHSIGKIEINEVDNRFLLNPAVVSAALASAMSYGPYRLSDTYNIGNDLFLPHKIAGLFISGAITGTYFTSLAVIKNLNKHWIELSLEIMDENNKAVLVIETLRLQRIKPDSYHALKVDSVSEKKSLSTAPSEMTETDIAGKNNYCEDIAVVGMSCRLPMSKNVEEFWNVLKNGSDCITEIPEGRWQEFDQWYDPDASNQHTSYSKWGGFIDDVDKFDPLFFNISPSEAELMDPQQRIFLEEAWRTIESAGYSSDTVNSKKCGVFVGCTTGDYGRLLAMSGEDTNGQTFMGTSSAILAARISYFLNLKGPSLSIDTACSSSLTAIHLACMSIRAGESDLALAGGISVFSTPISHILTSRVRMQSVDGRCFTFDKSANGTVFSEGCGVVMLKPLAQAEKDRDNIIGVIKGSGVNQDGKTNGITAPSARSQESLLRSIYKKHKINPADITYVEAHGTATSLGDPIEIQALTNAFHSTNNRKQYCAIGSVKSNIGHSSYAAGVAGLIKALLCLKYKRYVPSIHFKEANNIIDFESSPFFVSTTYKYWPKPEAGKRIAAVSSFGFSGANAHLVLEEYQTQYSFPDNDNNESNNVDQDNIPVIVPLSAKNRERLIDVAANLSNYLKVCMQGDVSGIPKLPEIAYTLQMGRNSMDARIAFVVHTISDLLDKLDKYAEQHTNISECYQGNAKANKKTLPFITDDASAGKRVRFWMQAGMTEKYLDRWANGMSVDWDMLYKGERPNKVVLPSYPFAKDRYWISAPVSRKSKACSAEDSLISLHPLATGEDNRRLSIFENSWTQQSVQKLAEININTLICFLSDREDQEEFVNSFKPEYTRIIFIAEGDAYVRHSCDLYEVDVSDKYTYEKTFKSIYEDIDAIDAVLYLWPLEDRHKVRDLATILLLLESLSSVGFSIKQLFLIGTIKNISDSWYFNRWNTLQDFVENSLQGTSLSLFIYQCSTPGISWNMQHWASHLLNEIKRNQPGYILYRDTTRFVRLTKELSQPSHDLCPIKYGGRYLIVCGCENMGRLLAEYVARSGAAKLVLVIPSTLVDDFQHTLNAIEGLSVDIRVVSLQLAGSEAFLLHANNPGNAINGIFYTGTTSDYSVADSAGIAHDALSSVTIFDNIDVPPVFSHDSLDFICHFLSRKNMPECPYMGSDNRNIHRAAQVTRLSEFQDSNRIYAKSVIIDWKTASIDSPNEIINTHNTVLYSDLDFFEKVFEQVFIQNDTCSFTVVEQGQPTQNSGFLDKWKKDNGQQLNDSNVDQSKNHKLSTSGLAVYIINDLKKIIHEQLKINQALLGVDTNFSEFGFDSILLTEFSHRLSRHFGVEIMPAVLFGNYTLEKLTTYLVSKNNEAIVGYYTKSCKIQTYKEKSPISLKSRKIPDNTNPLAKQNSFIKNSEFSFSPKRGTEKHPENILSLERVAIIGMSGKLPMANNLNIFWDNLTAGKDCISRIPRNRRDLQDGLIAEQPHDSCITWGGFIDGVAEFDPEFFGISEREAELMDPQQRLMLMYVYAALEDAGYSPKSLAGKNIAVFIATANSGYGGLVEKSGDKIEAYTATGTQPSVGPNRISFYLDLRGPSEPIETACASSLVAIRRGITALNDGCEMAIVGGVNTLLTSTGHIAYEKAGMLSEDGRCKTFSINANGFVRSEGAGILILKKRGNAENDGDNIYGLICGSAENHGGRAHSLTTPNPIAQTELLEKVYREANIDPRTVTYIEAHGTGTQLGDSIEIDGLKTAFESLIQRSKNNTSSNKVNTSLAVKGYCGLGSVKTNIGHTELASGVVGVIKVLLQMKHAVLVKNLNTNPLNPYLQLEGSPFFIVQNEQEWQTLSDDSGVPIPRRAGVSAFGMGGVNAHLILEEYVTGKSDVNDTDSLHLIVFSAKNKKQLETVVRQMLDYVMAYEEILLSNFAYTLQIGRDQLDVRLAMIVNDREMLITSIKYFLNIDESGDSTVPLCYSGEGRGEALDDHFIYELIENKNLEQLGQYWVRGGKIPWDLLHKGAMVNRISLPTYPFDTKPYWVSKRCRSGQEPMADLNIQRVQSEGIELDKMSATSRSPLFESWFSHG